MTSTLDRPAWREAVAAIAAKAREKLPECNGRVDAALKLVLQGDVELLPDGTAQVYSQSNGVSSYAVVNGHCDCADSPRAPHGFCKHRIAAGIAKRVGELLPVLPKLESPPVETAPAPAPAVPPALPEAPAAPLPEAAFSLCLKGRLGGQDAQLTIRGATYAEFAANVAAARAMLDPVQAPTSPQVDTPQCKAHGPLKRSTKGKGWYCPTKLDDDSWCPSKGK